MNKLLFYFILLFLCILIINCCKKIDKFKIFNKTYNTLDKFNNNSNNFIIPKILHQTYSSWENLPNDIKTIINENNNLNNNWKYKFYNNNEIDSYIKKNESDYVYKAFKKINPKFGASIADFFRYIILYHEGGVYMDVKCKCTTPFDKWVNSQKLQFSFWIDNNNYSDCNQYHKCKLTNTKRREITQMALVFPKNHKLMRLVIDQMVNDIYNYKETQLLISDKVLYTTGPWLFTKVVTKYMCNNLNNIKIYDKQFYNNYIIADGTYGKFTENQIKNGKYYKNLNNDKYIY